MGDVAIWMQLPRTHRFSLSMDPFLQKPISTPLKLCQENTKYKLLSTLISSCPNHSAFTTLHYNTTHHLTLHDLTCNQHINNKGFKTKLKSCHCYHFDLILFQVWPIQLRGELSMVHSLQISDPYSAFRVSLPTHLTCLRGHLMQLR